MPGPDPQDPSAATDSSGINISGGDIHARDIIGRDKIVQGDEVAQKIVFTQEQAYDVRGCENPYIGLSAFTYSERAKYAGREKLVAETVAKITAPVSPIPLLFVTGASGSGKSSFAQAGLLPALETFYDGITVKRAVMRPAGDPLAALNDALWRQLQLPLTPGVSADATGLLPEGIFRATPPDQVNLLVLDQFEEFFTQSPQTAREQFFAFLTGLSPFAKTHTHIIATMRADYLPDLFNYPALYEIAKRGVDLRAMNADELEQAIQQPLRASPYAATKKFDPALVDKLAQDAAQDAAYLPLLQVTLQEIWRKGFLKLEAYTSLTDAIKQRADQVLEYRDFDDAVPDEKRDPADQAALLNLLLDLVDVSADDDIHRDVRKQRAKTELTGGDPQREQWVKQLSDARLLSVQQEGKDAHRIEVDLIHETLLTNWARLQAAITERRTELRRRARFEQNLDEWLTIKLSAQDRADRYLLEGVRLAEARELDAHGDVALRNEDAKAYLSASVAKAETQERQRVRNLRLVAAALTVLVLLAGLAAIYAFVKQGDADQRTIEANQSANAAETAQAEAIAARDRAEQEAIISKSKSLAAISIANRTQDLTLAYLLGIEATKKGDSLEAQGNLFHLRFQPSSPKTFLRGHSSTVSNVAFSHDGKQVVSGSCKERDGQGDCQKAEIFLWDTVQNQHIGEFKGDLGSPSSLALSKDGKWLAAGDGTGKILLWDMATREPVGEFTGHESSLITLAFSPDSKTLASGDFGSTMILWDVTTQKLITQAEGNANAVGSVAFSPDGKILASAGWGMTVRLWDISTIQDEGTQTLNQVAELEGHTGAIYALAFSQNGSRLASGTSEILVWDVAAVLDPEAKSVQPIAELRGYAGAVHSLGFGSEAGQLISAADDEIIRLWDVDTPQQIKEFRGHKGQVLSAASSPDGKTIASGGVDKAVLLWNVESHQESGELLPDDFVQAIALSPDGKWLASGGFNALLWDISEPAGQIGTKPKAPDQPTVEIFDSITSLAFSPDSETLALDDSTGTIRLWDIQTRQFTGELTAEGQFVQGIAFSPDGIAFSPDGTILASANGDNTVWLWDVATRKRIVVLKGDTDAVTALAFSRDGSKLATGGCHVWVGNRLEGNRQCLSGQVWLWDMVNVRQGSLPPPILAKLNAHAGRVNSIKFSSDGSTLASAGDDSIIRLWDVPTQQLRGELRGHRDLVSSIAFNEDGKRLVSTSSDKTVRIWDVSTLQPFGELQGHTIDMLGVALSPDGMTLVAAGFDPRILLWDLNPQSWLESICKIVNSNLTRTEYAKYFDSDPVAYDTVYAKNPTCPRLPVEPLATPAPSPTP